MSMGINYSQSNMDNTYGQQNAYPPSNINNNAHMYGTGSQSMNDVGPSPINYIPNPNNGAPYLQDTRYHNPPEGQMYTPSHVQHNQYPHVQQYNSNDPIRSTIENIAGKDTWKKLSGGLSGGLNAFKGALGSLDYTIQNLAINGNPSSNQYTQQKPDNVYNPRYRDVNHMPSQSYEGVERQLTDDQNQYTGPDSIYNPGHRDLNGMPTPSFEPGRTVDNPNYRSETQNQYVRTGSIDNPLQSHQDQIFVPVPPVENPTITNGQFIGDDNGKHIVTMEDQFIGGGGSQNTNVNESQHLADRLDSSLLKLSSYLQNEMIQAGTGSQPIPQFVWDAMAEIEAVKNDLTSTYNVSRKEV